MNWLLRLFGIRSIDRGEFVITRCPTCGQPVAESWTVRAVSEIERATMDYQSDHIAADEFEQRVARALRREVDA